MTATPEAPSLSAEEISLRVLKLIDSIKSKQDFSVEHIYSVIGIRLLPDSVQPKYSGFTQVITTEWWYGFTLNSDPKDKKLIFSFDTAAGVAEDVAATPVCAFDFDHYVNALKTMGFEGSIVYGEHGRILNWDFYRNGINVQVSYRGESFEKAKHNCVSAIVIN